MIWYILYPFRGTTEPPRLSPSHPLRRFFTAHGTATARHWLFSILLTVLISVLLCYPALFQTDSPAAAGLRNLPKHVWTSTTEVTGTNERRPDVEVRQVWVHGDYMKALDQRVLQQALHVQTELIGDGFEERETPGATPANRHMYPSEEGGCLTSNYGPGWGFHSPLMYWNCSGKAIEEDRDFLATINARAGETSALNLTLRPSTVFAGKAFANMKLRAADALVITLFDKTFEQPKSLVGPTWEARSRRLIEELGPGWSLYPKNGQVRESRLYEFRFKPMTLNDDLLLACSYLVTAVYVIWRLVQLRAVKSKTGLLITICAKMTVCIIASFTVCTYLGIDLARIPRPWFPGVVFCFGLGNIFRLINVVLQTPLEMPPAQRIGHALGEIGHLSLAVACQNLVLIYLCWLAVTPMVKDFCVFAAVTLVLDFVFHLTFFVAVLSVDVQRMELQDSLERVDLTHTAKSGRQERQSWVNALRQGTVPVSTRFAGTAAILSMILAVNWHFFDSESRRLSPRDLFRLSARALKTPSVSEWKPPPINQARTPAEWFKIQDHNTARELVSFIRPTAHSFVARVYDPLLVVLAGAKGRDRANKSQSLLKFIRHFTHEHAFPAALIVVSLIATVTLLMNYLLWTGLPDDATEDDEHDETYFSVKTLPIPQELDVVRLASCPKGHIVSISLDKSTSLWLNERGSGYTNAMLKTANVKPKLWPIVACTLDDDGRLLALSSDTGQIGLWSITAKRFLLFPTVELRGQTPILFSFVYQHNSAEQDSVSLVIVTSDGFLAMVDPRTGFNQTKRICCPSILAATLYTHSKGDTSLVYVCKLGEVYILPLQSESVWTPEVVAGLDPGPPPGENPSKIRSIYTASNLSLIFAIRASEVEVVEFNSRALIHTIKINHAKPCTLRVMHSSRRPCPCGASAVRTLAIAYTDYDSDSMTMRTYTMDGPSSSSQICLGKPSENGSHSCKGWQQATETVHRVKPAGVWESTSTLSVVGVRKVIQSPTPSDYDYDYEASAPDAENGNGHFTAEPTALASALKMRATKEKTDAANGKSTTSQSHKPGKGLLASLDAAFHTNATRRNSDPSCSSSLLHDSDGWEAWTLSSTGEFLSRPLFTDAPDDVSGSAEDFALEQQQLFVAAAGPIARIGNKSVAVAFGNTVKILSVGKESGFEIGGGSGGGVGRLGSLGSAGRSSSETTRAVGVVGGGMEMEMVVGSYKWRRRAGRKIS